MHSDILQIRAPAINFYVLRDSEGLYLLDAGYIGGRTLLRRALRAADWDRDPIRGIIVTHGHLDHILHVAATARETGAWIVAPRLDADHYAGRSRYHGWAKVTQWLEAIGRPILGFAPFTPDRLVDDGDEIDAWHGLRAIHLPGHTNGHTGYYCARLKLLFSADLFASYRIAGRLPPNIFNAEPDQIPQSIEKALTLDLDEVIPNHCDRATPAVHLKRLRRLRDDLSG